MEAWPKAMKLILEATWEWCKKQWKVCLGFIVGIFSIMLLFRKNNDVDGLFKEKSKAEKAIAEAAQEAERKREESLQKNLDNFFEKNKEIDLSLKKKLKNIDDKKKEKINAILESEDPNEAIAHKLKEFLNN